MIKIKPWISVVWLVLFTIVFIFGLQGCISTGDIEGIVDKGGKAAGTVILASAGKDLTKTRLTKAKTVKSFKNEELKAKIIITQTRWNGFFMLMLGFLLPIFIASLAKVIKYFYPKPTAIFFGNKNKQEESRELKKSKD